MMRRFDRVESLAAQYGVIYLISEEKWWSDGGGDEDGGSGLRVASLWKECPMAASGVNVTRLLVLFVLFAKGKDFTSFLPSTLSVCLLQSTPHSHLQYLPSSYNTYFLYVLLSRSDSILLRCVLACINRCSSPSTVSQPRPLPVHTSFFFRFGATLG